MRRDDKIRLPHMPASAREAVAVARRRTRGLANDRQLALAPIKDVEIIREAATGVTDPTRQHLSEIPWERIVGMRNRLVHAYFDIPISSGRRYGETCRNQSLRSNRPSRPSAAQRRSRIGGARDHRPPAHHFPCGRPSPRGAGPVAKIKSALAVPGPVV